MKFMKRKNIYQASNYNVTFNPVSKRAMSYNWWCFVAVVEDKLIFNNYKYSITTCKHQSKVRDLLNNLNIKIDMELPIPSGLQSSKHNDFRKPTLNKLIVEAEEYLCDKFLSDTLKKQENYQKNKFRKLKNKLEAYLENSVCFRDYEIKPKSQFGTYNKIAVHQIVDDLEEDVENALNNFIRDGFGCVVFYV